VHGAGFDYLRSERLPTVWRARVSQAAVVVMKHVCYDDMGKPSDRSVILMGNFWGRPFQKWRFLQREVVSQTYPHH
jgi:hypothetical protein